MDPEVLLILTIYSRPLWTHILWSIPREDIYLERGFAHQLQTIFCGFSAQISASQLLTYNMTLYTSKTSLSFPPSPLSLLYAYPRQINLLFCLAHTDLGKVYDQSKPFSIRSICWPDSPTSINFPTTLAKVLFSLPALLQMLRVILQN